MSMRSRLARLVDGDFAFSHAKAELWNLRLGDSLQAYIVSGLPAGPDMRQSIVGRVFDAAPYAVLLLGERNEIVGCNKAAFTALGCREPDILGRAINAFWKPGPHEPQPGTHQAANGTSQAGMVLPRKGRPFAAVLAIVEDIGATEDCKLAIICDSRPGREIVQQVQRLKKELASFARLSALGELADTLEQQLAQPLSQIADHAQRCIRLLSSDPDGAIEEAREVLVAITEQALLASDSITHLRECVGRGKGDNKVEWTGAVPISTRLQQLTIREHQVLAGVMDGLQNKTIAFNLGISARTVEAHRANLMAKMGARNLAELMRMTMSSNGVSEARVSA